MAPTTTTDRRLFDVTGAATYLGISRAQCYRLLAAGDLTYLTVGSRRRIPREVLDGYIDRRLAAAQDPAVDAAVFDSL